MTTVVDSNIIAALMIPVPYSPLATRHMNDWDNKDESLIAPLLFEYELVSITRRSVALGHLAVARASAVLDGLLNSRVVTIRPTASQHENAYRLAGLLGRSKAYDAQYLALAEREAADFWTADRRLANRCQQLELSWVHWIGE